MGDTGDSKRNIIKRVFETMDYPNDVENLTEGIEWIKAQENRNYTYVNKKDELPNGGEVFTVSSATNDGNLCNIHIPDSNTIQTILNHVSKAKNSWIEVAPTKRAQIIYNLGTEIKKKENLLVQLEIAARGILSKDTKTKTLPLLTDCLHYYSAFSTKANTGNSSFTQGLVVAILPDVTPLSTLGYILGPCLASGYQLILQTEPQLTLVTTFITDLALQLGLPENTIRILPGSIDPNIFFAHSGVSTIMIFDDLHREKFLIANHFNKKLIHLHSSGTSTIVFDNCDLDSACHGVLEGAFGYKGMLPWSTRHVFVQENVFEAFIHKLKHNAGQLKIGKGDEKNVDSSYPNGDVLDKVWKIAEEAKNSGVEIFQPNSDHVIPILLIGSNIFPNNVIKEDCLNVPVVTIVAFRSINEAVSLSNNSRQGLGISVWTESTSLANEIIGKLKVGNVWVNCVGLFAANISSSPFKSSGNAYFGGREGFYQLIETRALRNESISHLSTGEAMEKAITESKKSLDMWSKLPYLDRMKNLQLLAQVVETYKKNSSLPENWLDQWVALIFECVSNNPEETLIQHKSHNVVTMREPQGIIAVEAADDKENHNKRLIIGALNEGNAVILLNNCDETVPFYTHISKNLPKGVFTLVTNSQDVAKVAALHKELHVYFGEKNSKVFGSLPLKSSSKFRSGNLDNWRAVRNNVTLVKNVWFNKGQSFI